MKAYSHSLQSLAIFFVFILMVDFGFGGEVRTFKNREGKELVAEFMAEISGKISIKRVSDGKLFLLPIDSLSDEDQQWVKKQKQQKQKQQQKKKHQSPEGVWGGKWDDKWPVFLTVEKGDSMGHYRVMYSWRENLGSPLLSMTQSGEDKGTYIQTKALYFKLSGETGMLYGRFSNPRMANLVRISGENKALEEVNLEDYGWEEGCIPAAEAFKEITGEASSE